MTVTEHPETLKKIVYVIQLNSLTCMLRTLHKKVGYPYPGQSKFVVNRSKEGDSTPCTKATSFRRETAACIRLLGSNILRYLSI